VDIILLMCVAVCFGGMIFSIDSISMSDFLDPPNENYDYDEKNLFYFFCFCFIISLIVSSFYFGSGLIKTTKIYKYPISGYEILEIDEKMPWGWMGIGPKYFIKHDGVTLELERW